MSPRRTTTYAARWPIRRRRWKFWVVVAPIGLAVCIPLTVVGDLAGELLGALRRWEERR